MTTPTTHHEHYETLLMKAVDGVLTEAERSELEAHVATCERCRQELADFESIKEVTDMLSERIRSDARLEPPRESRATRRVLYLGFSLVFAGVLVLLGFAAYDLATDPDVPVLVKLGSLVAGVGGLILLAYVLRVRLRGLTHDPYSEIDQ